MIELKTSDCLWGMTVMILGIALHCYTAGEFLASLLTTGLLTVLLALMLLSTFLAWHTGKLAIIRTQVGLRNLAARRCPTSLLARLGIMG
jgi:hypothetical protein